MKRRIMTAIALFTILLLCVLTACGGQAADGGGDNGGGNGGAGNVSGGGVLVAYFSRSGNTAEIAKLVAAAVGGDLARIEPASPYPEFYDEVLAVARQERADDARPALSAATIGIDMDKYSAVFLGYPIWHGGEPMIVRSFCDAFAGLKDKKVYTFSTSASSGGAAAQASLKSLYPAAGFGDGLHLTSAGLADAPSAVNAWTEKLGLSAAGGTESVAARVTMTFAGERVTIALNDNAAGRDFAARLRVSPLTLVFSDFGGSEKIAYPSPPLDVGGAGGCDPEAGDVTVYKPWGNIAVFYRDTSGYSDALAPVGKIADGGVAKLAAQTGGFAAELTLVG